ncbi:MAG: hypothetical protein KTR32_28335, partial [Granulosicoccus sp.]|nr:hypothetical protein [Granulosicoccus sp.]
NTMAVVRQFARLDEHARGERQRLAATIDSANALACRTSARLVTLLRPREPFSLGIMYFFLFESLQRVVSHNHCRKHFLLL